MIKNKITDIFAKQKQKQKAKTNSTYFNQTYFECKLAYHPHKLSLIKVNAKIIAGKQAGSPMMIKCKWYTKREKKYAEIQGVSSGCYQPCIDDVGCSICVQIEPIIQGKTYTGATIVKETAPLQLGISFQTQFTQLKNNLLHKNIPSKFAVKIQSIKGCNAQIQQQQLPQEAEIEIRKQQDQNCDIKLVGHSISNCYWITRNYPKIEFIRKSYNSIIMNLSENDCIRIAFYENNTRQLFGMLMKNLVAYSTIQDEQNFMQQQFAQIIKEDQQYKKDEKQGYQVQQQDIADQQCIEKDQNFENEKEQKIVNTQNAMQRQKTENIQKTEHQEQALTTNIQEIKKYNTNSNQSKMQERLIQKQNSLLKKEVKQMKKINERLSQQLNNLKQESNKIQRNFNMQRQRWAKTLKQIKQKQQKIQQINFIQVQKSLLKQQSQKLEDSNRFYKNQISFLKKQLKKAETQTTILSQKVSTLQKQLQSKNQKNRQTVHSEDKSQQIQKKETLIKQLLETNEHLKQEVERNQNQLTASQKKIQSLSLQKSIKQVRMRSEQSIPLQENFEETLNKKNKKIQLLQFKLANLQSILKYKTGEKGNEVLGLQKIINSMTQTITQKDEQIKSLRNINKKLASQNQQTL